MSDDRFPGWHGTTILAVRRAGQVVVAGDGQNAMTVQIYLSSFLTAQTFDKDVAKLSCCAG